MAGTRQRSTVAVILAAGKGKRLRSTRPKVLQPICGEPALWHVLQLARAARPKKILVVVGHGGQEVRDAVGIWSIRPEPVFVEQPEPLGTGHAVLVAEKAVGNADDVLVLGGDFDPIRPQDVRALISTHRRTKSAASILTTELDEPGGFARIVREGSRLKQIVEGFDAPPELRRIKEVSLLAFVFRREELFSVLPAIGRENRQKEYYLNEALTILLSKGEKIAALKADSGGAMGINSRAGVAQVERVLRKRINERHMAAGVTIQDPGSTYIDVGVKIQPEAVIRPMTFLEGSTVIGSGALIGPSTRIVDSKVADEAEVTFSVILDSRIGRRAHVGPFARVRGGSVLADGTEVGNFVEVNRSKVGIRTKAKHLSYLGDARVGKDVNFGAGTVTANYDGYRKHKTRIGDDARIGSDTMLVAPISVGKGAVTGAGSVVTDDVPAGALVIERGEQKTVRGYRARKDAENRGKGAR